MENFEEILAKIAENTKMLEGKVVIDPVVFDELKASNAKSIETVTAANAEIEKLKSELETVSAKCETFETEKVISECVAYVEKTEKELVEAAAKAEAEKNRRKEELTKAGIADEKIIETALTVDEKSFQAIIASAVNAVEVAKAAAIKEKQEEIKKEQEAMGKTVASADGISEMNLDNKPFSERLRTVVKKTYTTKK